jgi:hypothetical protein
MNAPCKEAAFSINVMKFDVSELLANLRTSLCNNPLWRRKLSTNTNDVTVHLAILREPYLSFIMDGKKKVESRFAKRACAPYERVSKGDIVLLKKTGGEIIGICEVEQVWFYRLNSTSLDFIKDRFGELICPADANFWIERKDKCLATLMRICNVTAINGIHVKKRDRRGWVTFRPSLQESLV